MGNKYLDGTALTIAIIGAVNWGLIGLFRFDLVAFLFGDMSWFPELYMFWWESADSISSASFSIWETAKLKVPLRESVRHLSRYVPDHRADGFPCQRHVRSHRQSLTVPSWRFHILRSVWQGSRLFPAFPLHYHTVPGSGWSYCLPR